MSQLPFELSFCHRFNIHKFLGLDISDDDLPSIARIYGVDLSELKSVDDTFKVRVREAAEKIRSEVPRVTPDKQDIYLALGDSITSDRTSYAKIIRQLWDGENVIDAGVSGDTVSDVVNRFYSTVLNNEFDVASIFIGTNDSRGVDDSFGITNTSIKEYERKLTYFIRRLKETAEKVIVITLPPAKNDDIRSYLGDEPNYIYRTGHLAAMNKTIRKTAKKNGAELVDLAAEIETTGLYPLDEDGLHLNIEAQTLCAKMVLKELV